MRYLLIDEGGNVNKTSVLTEDILDELRVGKRVTARHIRQLQKDNVEAIIDTTTVMECYYLDNDHQPVWEVILERG